MDDYVLLSTTLQCLGFAVLAAHLFRTGLADTFRPFTILCLFEPIRVAASAWIPRNTDSYAHFYFVTQPVIWTIYIWMTLEVFRGALGSYRALYTLSRQALTGCMVVALLVATATLGLDFRRPGSPYPILELFLLVERTVAVSLLVFVFALMALLTWFPVPLNRNSLAHAVVFTFFFSAKTAMLFSRNLFGPAFTRTGNMLLLAAILISLLLWRILLVRAGSASMVHSGVSRDPETEARLMAQLEDLNQTLAGSLRK